MGRLIAANERREKGWVGGGRRGKMRKGKEEEESILCISDLDNTPLIPEGKSALLQHTRFQNFTIVIYKGSVFILSFTTDLYLFFVSQRICIYFFFYNESVFIHLFYLLQRICLYLFICFTFCSGSVYLFVLPFATDLYLFICFCLFNRSVFIWPLQRICIYFVLSVCSWR